MPLLPSPHIYKHECTGSHTHTHMYACTGLHTHTYTHTHSHAHTYAYTHIHRQVDLAWLLMNYDVDDFQSFLFDFQMWTQPISKQLATFWLRTRLSCSVSSWQLPHQPPPARQLQRQNPLTEVSPFNFSLNVVLSAAYTCYKDILVAYINVIETLF